MESSGNTEQGHESAFSKLDERLERIEQKLDNHLERVTRAETSISWIQGHLRIATTILLSFIGAAITYFINKLPGSH